MTDPSKAGFYILPFAFDGEPVGFGFWDYSKLSGRWLRVCAEHFAAHGSSFESSLGGPLSHISIKWTSGEGSALGTVSVRGETLRSLLLLSGKSVQADAQLAGMFAKSLRNVKLVRQASSSEEPFEKIFVQGERPLLVTVTWPRQSAPEADLELVRELGLHFAGAFFRGL